MNLRVHFVYAPDPFSSEHQNFGNKYLPLWALTLAAYLPSDGSQVVGPQLSDRRCGLRSPVVEAPVDRSSLLVSRDAAGGAH